MKTTKIQAKNKIQWKSARRKCRSHLNQKLLSENFIFDPLNVFPNPMCTISIRII